ncbi:MAG: ParB/RepB/Spo0J family partition protein [Clostridia bacterium]|nr:ParB/RepB/Spo0J family partition protein [Clostridia bacterium]
MATRSVNGLLTSVDSLFTTQQERDEANLKKIYDIPLSEIDDFPDHPYKVNDDEDMDRLVESIKERGIITPATVRQKEDGRYELISGHRRKRACEIAEMETLRCEVVEMTKDEATILMVESNYQRSNILPSEKAFAYKMRLDAMKRQGKRNDLTCATELHKSDGKKSRDIIAEETGESHEMIRMYVRLTNLVPEMLEYVDEGRMKMRPAVELSYLDEESQRDVVDRIEETEIFPSHAQTRRMRKLFEEGALDYDKVSEIMEEIKPNQVSKRKFSYENLRQYIPDSYPDKKAEELVIKALDHYFRYLQRQKEQSR